MPADRSRGYTRGPHIKARKDGRLYVYFPATERGGKPRKVDLGTRDWREAEQKFAELLGGRRSAGKGPPREETIDRIAEAYLTAPHGWKKRTDESSSARVWSWALWCEARKITLPSQLTGEDARAWVKSILDRGNTNATANRDMIVVRKMLRWASHQDRALCGETPFHRLELLPEDRRKKAPIVPSPAEVARVVAVIDGRGHTRPVVVRGKKQPPRERTRADVKFDASAEARLGACWVATTLATGARISETRTITEAQVHPGGWVVPPSKGRAERVVPFGDDVERVVREFARMLGAVKSRNGRPVSINDRWAIDLLAWACAEAEVPVFKPHDLRRTFATECRREGIPITTIRDLMGHADTSTTERYIGRYRQDASVQVPTPRALSELLAPSSAVVLPFRGR